MRKLVSVNKCFFSPRDFSDYTIHEGVIGVLHESEGQRIATQMRNLAKEHFRNTGIKGISTRISKNNLVSLNSAKKLGFEQVEESFDTVMN